MRKTEEMNGAGAMRSHAASREMEDVLQGSAPSSRAREGRRAARVPSDARMIKSPKRLSKAAVGGRQLHARQRRGGQGRDKNSQDTLNSIFFS